MSPAIAHLALGSNLGDREAILREAARRIAALPATELRAASHLYRTKPWGKPDQPDFLNAALSVRTELSPHALLDHALLIEAALGRERRERWGPRLIDIDLLTHADATIATPRLTLPHPALAERAFVLVPLREIAPDFALRGIGIDHLLAGLDHTSILRHPGPPLG